MLKLLGSGWTIYIESPSPNAHPPHARTKTYGKRKTYKCIHGKLIHLLKSWFDSYYGWCSQLFYWVQTVSAGGRGRGTVFFFTDFWAESVLHEVSLHEQECGTMVYEEFRTDCRWGQSKVFLYIQGRWFSLHPPTEFQFVWLVPAADWTESWRV